jgi:hypothetical protein
MYALQRPQCNPRNQLPQVRLPEPAPQEQRAKSVIDIFQYFFLSFLVFLTKTKIKKNGYKSHHDFHARLMNRPCIFRSELCGVIRDTFSFLCVFSRKCLDVALVTNPVDKTQFTQFLAHPQNIRFIRPVLCIYVDHLAVVA